MTDPRTVRQKILEGARKWMGPWEGLVFMRLRRNLKYFIFCLTSPPEMQISSQRTTTTFWPFRSSFATMEARRPSMWWRASTTTRFAQIPEPDTIFFFVPKTTQTAQGKPLLFVAAGCSRKSTLGFLKTRLLWVGFYGPSPTQPLTILLVIIS